MNDRLTRLEDDLRDTRKELLEAMGVMKTDIRIDVQELKSEFRAGLTALNTDVRPLLDFRSRALGAIFVVSALISLLTTSITIYFNQRSEVTIKQEAMDRPRKVPMDVAYNIQIDDEVDN